MIIDAFKIGCDACSIVSLRKTDTSLINSIPISHRSSFLNRILIKVFKSYPVSEGLLKKIHEKKKKFILYTSWAYRESISTPSVDKLVSSNLCYGHFYIEEGQATYRENKPHPSNLIASDKSLHAENFKNIYRDDALGYIGILPGAFPKAPCEKRIIMDNYEDLTKDYDPKLIGVKTIGLSCAERRLKKDEWESMLNKLIKSMPMGGVIKLHPSFTSNSIIKHRIVSIFNRISPNNISLCSDKAIIEIEMLYEPKILVGSLTSLNRYAEAFGSEFIKVDLY